MYFKILISRHDIDEISRSISTVFFGNKIHEHNFSWLEENNFSVDRKAY